MNNLYGNMPDEDRPFLYVGATPAGEWVVMVKETRETKRASEVSARTTNVEGGPFQPRKDKCQK